MSLQARLVVGLVVVVAAGLGLAGWLTNAGLRSFLVERTDEQLVNVIDIAAAEVGGVRQPNGELAPANPRTPIRLPGGSYAAMHGADGAVLVVRVFEFTPGGGADGPAPAEPDRDEVTAVLPEGFAERALAAVPADPVLVTLAAGDGSGRFRVLGVRVPQPGRFLVIAIPLDEVDETVHRLGVVSVVVGAVVAGIVAVGGWWLAGAGLRPLARMGAATRRIAGGDLSHRVSPDGDRSEIARLGHDVNTMLGQIEHAFEERRAAEDRLRRFVSDASHELRTPLTSIRGYAELFHRGAAERPEDLARVMARIEAEAARMGALVEDLLTLARLDEDRPLQPSVFDLADVARDAAADAAAVAGTHRLVVEAPEPLLVDADEAKVRQVAANLMANARTHTPAGTTVVVRAVARGADAVLEVADDGPGLSPDDAAHVFERFWRPDDGRARARGGSGLGLSIVAAIAAAHGGRAEVSATPGGGATFTVTLPGRAPAPTA